MSCPWSAGQLFFLCYYRINMPPLCEIGQGWLKAFDNARLTADNFKKASLSPVRNDYGQWMERDSISRIILRNQGEYALGIVEEIARSLVVHTQSCSLCTGPLSDLTLP